MADAHREGPLTVNRVLKVLADIFPGHAEKLTAESGADQVPDWDSLHTIHVAMGMESEFGVELAPEEIAGMQSVPVILKILAAKGIS